MGGVDLEGVDVDGVDVEGVEVDVEGVEVDGVEVEGVEVGRLVGEVEVPPPPLEGGTYGTVEKQTTLLIP